MRRLVAALETADPADPAWTWAEEQTVGFTFRRQAHEALIHRVDAEQTAGVPLSELDVALSVDGVSEIISVMLGGCPPWGSFAPLPHYVRMDLTDADTSIWVQLGRFTGTDPDSGTTYDDEDIHPADDPGTEPDATVAGTAAALNLWLWKRGDDAALEVTGDRGIYDRFRVALQPAARLMSLPFPEPTTPIEDPREVLLGYLAFYRSVLVDKLHGLDDEALSGKHAAVGVVSPRAAQPPDPRRAAMARVGLRGPARRGTLGRQPRRTLARRPGGDSRDAGAEARTSRPSGRRRSCGRTRSRRSVPRANAGTASLRPHSAGSCCTYCRSTPATSGTSTSCAN